MGRSPRHSTVVVTTGLLETLDRTELDAALAHELAHVKRRDVAVMSVAALLPTFSLFVASFATPLLGAVVDVAKRSFRGGTAGLVLVAAAIPVLLVSGAFRFASLLLARVLGRYREYAADRGAVGITGDPAGLASALGTLDDEIAETPTEDLRELDGVAALSVAPLPVELGPRAFPMSHPLTEARIERLRAMETTLKG